MPETTEKTWKVTAYRDSEGYIWAGQHMEEPHDTVTYWDCNTRDDRFAPDGAAWTVWDQRYATVEELTAARGPLTPAGVDDIEALLADHLATVAPGKPEFVEQHLNWQAWKDFEGNELEITSYGTLSVDMRPFDTEVKPTSAQWAEIAAIAAWLATRGLGEEDHA